MLGQRGAGSSLLTMAVTMEQLLMVAFRGLRGGRCSISKPHVCSLLDRSTAHPACPLASTASRLPSARASVP